MEAQAGLRVMSITVSDMVRQLESAVQFGQPVLVVDVLEEIDPVLEPLLAKAYVK
jgi:dynein heavy chain